jgi:acyl-CoA synthetase (NDP forming)
MVNPNRKTVLGHECYPDISAVPEHIDLSIIVTPAPTVPEIVEECGKADTEGVIIISAGFREIGEEGIRLEDQIKAIRVRLNLLALQYWFFSSLAVALGGGSAHRTGNASCSFNTGRSTPPRMT